MQGQRGALQRLQLENRLASARLQAVAAPRCRPLSTTPTCWVLPRHHLHFGYPSIRQRRLQQRQQQQQQQLKYSTQAAAGQQSVLHCSTQTSQKATAPASQPASQPRRSRRHRRTRPCLHHRSPPRCPNPHLGCCAERIVQVAPNVEQQRIHVHHPARLAVHNGQGGQVNAPRTACKQSRRSRRAGGAQRGWHRPMAAMQTRCRKPAGGCAAAPAARALLRNTLTSKPTFAQANPHSHKETHIRTSK